MREHTALLSWMERFLRAAIAAPIVSYEALLSRDSRTARLPALTIRTWFSSYAARNITVVRTHRAHHSAKLHHCIRWHAISHRTKIRHVWRMTYVCKNTLVEPIDRDNKNVITYIHTFSPQSDLNCIRRCKYDWKCVYLLMLNFWMLSTLDIGPEKPQWQHAIQPPVRCSWRTSTTCNNTHTMKKLLER